MNRLRHLMGWGLLAVMTASGAMDAYRLLIPRLNHHEMYTNEELALAEWVKENTAPESIWLTATHHNNWLFNLTGRQALVTYEGWLWTHGYQYTSLMDDLRAMFADPSNRDLFRKHRIDYVVIGPIERRDFVKDPAAFLRHFPAVYRTANYWILATAGGAQARAAGEVPELKPIMGVLEDRGLQPGLVYKRFKGAYFYGEPDVTTDGDTAFQFWYDDGAKRPFTSPVSMSWEGYIKVERGGRHAFTLESDDGSWLSINDVSVVDNGGQHMVQSVGGSADLSPGFYKIRLRYFDESGGAILKVFWAPPGSPSQPLPSTVLFHKP